MKHFVIAATIVLHFCGNNNPLQKLLDLNKELQQVPLEEHVEQRKIELGLN